MRQILLNADKIPNMTEDEFRIFLCITKETEENPFVRELKRSSPTKNIDEGGDVYYVWRMLVWQVSDEPRHHCMPIGADLYINLPWSKRKERCNELDKFIDRIMEQIPKDQWIGVLAWAQALGGVGWERPTT